MAGRPGVRRNGSPLVVFWVFLNVAAKNKAKKPSGEGTRVIASNRRARHEYHVLEELEAGLVLKGTEVKSLRQGRCSLADSYASFQGGELFLHHMHIPPYEQGNRFNVDPTRSRKLLLHASQLRHLVGAVTQKGLTLIPLCVYFAKQHAKVAIALCKGKRAYDKRDAIRRRDEERDMDREAKGFRYR